MTAPNNTERQRPRGWVPRVLPVPTAPGVWLVESRSQPLTFRTVRSVLTGFVNCNCEKAQFRPQSVCDHIRQATRAAMDQRAAEAAETTEDCEKEKQGNGTPVHECTTTG